MSMFFEAARQALLADFPELEGESAHSLAALLTHIRDVQQKLLARSQPGAPIKLPMSFLSVSSNDAEQLQQQQQQSDSRIAVLAAAIEFKTRRMRPMQDQDDAVNMEMLRFVGQQLIERGVWVMPRICFDETMEQPMREEAEELVARLQGRVVSDLSDATHVISPTEEQPVGLFYRALERNDDQVFVHIWYHPDSYNRWHSISASFDPPAPIETRVTGRRTVTVQFLKDSVAFNEFMNEDDYDPSLADSLDRIPYPFSLDGQPRRPSATSAPNANSSSNLTAPADASRDAVQPGPNGDSMDVDRPALPATSSTGRPNQALGFSKIQDEMRKYLVQQTHEVIIPSYSAWFDMSTIHEIEAKALPEFFNGRNRSKTPTVYKEYRDFMINVYRLDPSEYLTVTACRRNLAGDVCAIIRVHAFLEQWGLINYQVDPDTRPSVMGPAFTGHFRITADTPRGLQPFLPAMSAPAPATPPSDHRTTTTTTITSSTTTTTTTHLQPSQQQQQQQQQQRLTNGSDVEPPQSNGTANGVHASNMALRKDLYAPSDAVLRVSESVVAQQTFSCFTCGTDCTKSRYHSLKTPDINLCPNCYLEGRFPSMMYSSDFVRLDHTPLNPSAAWTDQETLLLLEGIEMHEDNWGSIAEHVGTRTREQCIAHFLELPIEEPYDGARMSDLGPLQYQRPPFTDAENPILSLVAFMASVVKPEVAKAAAQAAITRAGGAVTSLPAVDTSSGNAAADTDAAAAATATATADAAREHSAMDVDHKDAARRIEAATATALGAAAAKAHSLVQTQDREMSELMRELVEAQIAKVDIKLRHFEEMEAMLEHERSQVELMKQQVYLDKLALKKASLAVVAASAAMTAAAAAAAPPAAPLDPNDLLQESLVLTPGDLDVAPDSADMSDAILQPL
ncbi:SWI/SNF and RSC complex subunit Ssr2 [Sorochytrium milnesiophthora]